jgi:hypothetical protein
MEIAELLPEVLAQDSGAGQSRSEPPWRALEAKHSEGRSGFRPVLAGHTMGI